MSRNTGGNRGGVRQSALWGSGNRGGEFRSNALWGKGGRGLVTTVVALALAMPLAAGAGGQQASKEKPVRGGTYVSEQLKQKAKNSPNELVKVIVQAESGVNGAERATKALGKLNKKLDLIGAVAAEMRAKDVEKLEGIPGLTVTLDAQTNPSAYSSNQLWTRTTGVNKLWGGPQAPTIAIVDSGIENRDDFGDRIRASVNFVSSGTNSDGDGRGHGTFVAGIAAGSAAGYAGAAPNAGIVSLDVMNDSGFGLTSDVIRAAEWIYANKDAYNIKVANFSLHSGSIGPFYNDPLNRAVEKLWFAGVTVVASAGNYGNATSASGVRYAPGNDPFVITVGAADIGGTAKIGDDSRAPWSAYGRTYDGFWKPEICAPGRYMVAPIPAGSTLAAAKADKLQAGGYIELSGTSFSAPVVSGIAAQILARHPEFGPDEIKGALMRRARPVPQAAPLSCGVGQVNAVGSTAYKVPATPNKALRRFVVPDAAGVPAFDAVSWTGVSWTDVSWDAVSWTDVSWTDVSWTDVSWTDVSWTDVVLSDVSWTDVSWEDGAGGDTLDLNGYELTAPEETAAALDPALLLPGETLPTSTATTSILP